MLRVPGADELLRGSLLHLSDSRTLAQWLTHNPFGRSLADRFVAGETLDSAIMAVRELNAESIRGSLDHLGEAVTNPAEAIQSADDDLDILRRLHETGVDCNVSLKLTQMGLDVSQMLCLDNLLRVLDKAREIDQFVRLDMESSRHTEDTLRIFEHLWTRGYRNCGVVLQAYLYRTERDVDWAVELGCRVRLCKGAYAEPPSIAFSEKRDTDANYVKLARRLLDGGRFPAMATHDLRIIREIESWRPDPSSFEFQMLYGVRPQLQRQLVAAGWGMRAYVPFGSDWYAYFMRRLAERPANLMFFLMQLLPHRNGTADRSAAEWASLAGRVALVTGASRGVGRACAEAFAREGAQVAALARSGCDLPDMLCMKGDVASPEDVERAFKQIEERLGPVDILVNNAGILGPSEAVAEADPQQWFDTYRVNVWGAMLCAQRALPKMIARRQGKIINVSSGAALVPIAGYTAYSSSKAALLHFSTCLADEVKSYGINVNCIGVWARTDMWEDQLRQAPMPAVEDAAARGQQPTPEENVDTILFLASAASDHLTGQQGAACQPISEVGCEQLPPVGRSQRRQHNDMRERKQQGHCIHAHDRHETSL